MRKTLLQAVMLLTVLSLVLSACGGGVEEVGGFQIPAVKDGKFNVAMVLIGTHDDGGWSQAHYEGLLYIEENVPDVNIAYVENVPEGAAFEQVFRALARKGFDMIFGTSFGFGDPMEIVAGEFPDTMFIRLTGIKCSAGAHRIRAGVECVGGECQEEHARHEIVAVCLQAYTFVARTEPHA